MIAFGAGQRGVDLGVGDVARIHAVAGLDVRAVDELEEVRGARVVLRPTRHASLGVRLLVADRLVVDGARDDPWARLEAELIQEIRQVLGSRLVGRGVVAEHVDLSADGTGVLDELLRLREIRSLRGISPRARLELLVTRDRRRQEVAVGLQQATGHAGQRPLIDGGRDGLADAHVVERRDLRVEEEVARRVGRRLAVAALGRLADPPELVAGRCTHQHIGGALDDVVGLTARALHDRQIDPARLAGRDVRQCGEVGVALEGERAVRLHIGERVRPDARQWLRRRVLEGRVTWDERRERRRETVGELAVGLREFDRDVAGRIVGRDAGKVGVGLAALDVAVGALDPGEEERSAGFEVQHALDPVLEVARLCGSAIGVLQPRTELQAVRLAVGADLGEVLGETGDELRALRALLVGIREQARVRRPQGAPPLLGVGERRVEEVGEGTELGGDRRVGHRRGRGGFRHGVVAAGGEQRSSRGEHGERRAGTEVGHPFGVDTPCVGLSDEHPGTHRSNPKQAQRGPKSRRACRIGGRTREQARADPAVSR